MTKAEKTKELIEALQKERASFVSREQDTFEHDVTIEYLQNGETDENPDNIDMLYAAIYDFDCLYSDYCQ